jgi:hypothetical protein
MLLGTIFIVLELSLGVRSYKAMHERQKKQATIEHVRAIRPIYTKCREIIDNELGKDVITEKILPEILANPEILENVKDLLSLLEHTSVGMNTGVFDKELWYRMSASYLINIYHRLHVYIKYIQKNHQYAYIEFEELILEFENRKRQKPDPRGIIKHS